MVVGSHQGVPGSSPGARTKISQLRFFPNFVNAGKIFIIAFSRPKPMNQTKLSTSLIALLMIAGIFAGCLGGETIDDTARTDIDDLSASTTENQTTMNTDMDSIELDVTALSNSLGSLSSDLTSLGNDLTAKETALLSAISTAEESIASLETHNSALMTTLSGMNDSNSAEAQSLQAQITTNAANIATLSTDLQTLTDELAAVQSSIVALSSTVTSLESTLTSVESMATQNAADVDELETASATNAAASATNAAAIADLVDQLAILTEDIDVLYEVLEGSGNQNDALYNDLTYTVEEDWDGDGIVDYSYSLSVMSCMEISFEDLSYIDFGEAEMLSIDFRYVDLSFTNLSSVYAEPIPCSGIHDDYNGTIWDKTMFLHSDLSYAEVVNSYFPASIWAFSILDYANFTDSYFGPLDWYEMDELDQINFEEGWMGNGTYLEGNSAIGALFDGTEMSYLIANQNNFSMSSFVDSNLFNSSFGSNDFTNADFSSADLTNTSGYDNVWDGVDFTYADLTNSTIDFSGATGITWYYTTCPDGSSTGSSGSC